MDLLAIVGAGLVAAVLALFLKQQRPETGLLLSMAAVVMLFGPLLAQIIPAFAAMREAAERTGVSGSYLSILLKCLGVCYLTGLGSTLCKEAGQQAIAFQLELAGRIIILLLALPLFQRLLEIVLTLLG